VNPSRAEPSLSLAAPCEASLSRIDWIGTFDAPGRGPVPGGQAPLSRREP